MIRLAPSRSGDEKYKWKSLDEGTDAAAAAGRNAGVRYDFRHLVVRQYFDFVLHRYGGFKCCVCRRLLCPAYFCAANWATAVGEQMPASLNSMNPSFCFVPS